MHRPRLLPALLVVASIATACGSSARPSPSVGDLTAVLGALVLRGATIRAQVSGDPGCTSSELHSNAVRISLDLAADGRSHEVYLFRWRRPADFASAAEPFGSCMDEYASARPGVNVRSLEIPPWRAYGPGWTDALLETLADALRATAGG